MGKVEVETAKKAPPNRSAKDRRNTLFRVLDGVLSLSHRKIHSEGNSDKAKQGWAKYDEITFNGQQMHFYREPKRFNA